MSHAWQRSYNRFPGNGFRSPYTTYGSASGTRTGDPYNLETDLFGLYIVLFESFTPEWPAHWSILKANPGESDRGSLIHVVGDSSDCFSVQFKRDYDLLVTSKQYRKYFVGNISDSYASMSGWNDGDTNAVDTLERLFLAEQVPASAMHPMNRRGNCQDWVRWYVTSLASVGILQRSSLWVIDEAPEFWVD